MSSFFIVYVFLSGMTGMNSYKMENGTSNEWAQKKYVLRPDALTVYVQMHTGHNLLADLVLKQIGSKICGVKILPSYAYELNNILLDYMKKKRRPNCR